jgi:hypothetical protein
MAKVSILKNGRYDQGGSGVLISDRHVLTAAHVVYDVVKNSAQFSVEVTMAKDEAKASAPIHSQRNQIFPRGTIPAHWNMTTPSSH